MLLIDSSDDNECACKCVVGGKRYCRCDERPALRDSDAD